MSCIFPLIWVWIEHHQTLTAGILTFTAVLVGLLLTRRQLVLTKTTEQAKLINAMSQYWDSSIMNNAREAIHNAKGKGLKEELLQSKEGDFKKWLELTRVGNFFEEMGNLVHDKAVDPKIVAGRFRTHIKIYYEYYTPFIEEEKEKQPTIYEYFAELKRKVEKIRI